MLVGQKMPDPAYIASIEEPFLEVTILTTDEFVGPILALAIDRRGQQKKLEYVSSNRVMLVYEMPLNEVILDFFVKLKSISRGYASLDYSFIGYRASELVKIVNSSANCTRNCFGRFDMLSKLLARS